MDKIITKTKNTLEGINRVSDVGEQTGDQENKMVEITDAKQNIETRMKRNEYIIQYSLSSGTIINTPRFTL